jgi:hypothetical protein
MSAVKRVADFWDAVMADWLGGEDVLPAALESWLASYSGRGAGQLTRNAFAEPYLGDLRGTPRFVILEGIDHDPNTMRAHMLVFKGRSDN